MEPFGWDSQEREYYVLDDNRMYRRTEPPLPAVPKAKPKSNSIKARAARRRAGKRRKVEEEIDSEAPDDEDTSQLDTTQLEEENNTELDTYGGYKWECVAVKLDDFNEFLDSIKKTKDPNEKELRARIIEDVLPVIEAAAEKQRRKQERREKELMVMERMAGAKRSSRLADKHERERREQDEIEAARKRAADLAAAHREQEKLQDMEAERRSRMMTREQRIKDREYKRLLMEEELARDAEEQKRIEEGEKRGSERHIRERIEKNKKELEDLEAEEDWTFDCSGCGKHGKNYDDGSHSVACERCNVWQHSKCLGVSKSAAEKDDFHFVCGDCRKREEEAKRPKIMLKFGASGPSSSPPQQPLSPTMPQQTARVVSVNVPRAVIPPHPGQDLPMGGTHTTQSPISRPSVPTPNSHLQTSPGDAQRSGLPLQQPRQVAIHGPSSPPNTVHALPAPRPQPNQQILNGNGVARYPPQAQSQDNGEGGQHAAHIAHSGLGMFAPVQATPRPATSQAQVNGMSPVPRRIPSPVLNPPTMSPTQGNPEVGPIAGVPGSSPSNYYPALSTPSANGSSSRPSSQEQHLNGTQLSSPPHRSFTSQSPNSQHLSGLSPRKQRVTSPLPPPSTVPEKQPAGSMSPPARTLNSASFNTNSNNILRSVSGTPIFPPAEKLAPSPEQMNREPMPTPSKQPSPIVLAGEWRRASSNGDVMQGVHMNGNSNGPMQQAATGTVPFQTQSQPTSTINNGGKVQQS